MTIRSDRLRRVLGVGVVWAGRRLAFWIAAGAVLGIACCAMTRLRMPPGRLVRP